MKTLLTTTAVMEAGAGLMLVLLPSTAAMLLFEPSLATSVGLNLIRVAGCAMLSLGVASGLARNDDQSRAAKGLVVGLLLYNLGIALIGVQAGLQLSISSQGIWASTGLHTGMAFWCWLSLRNRGPMEPISRRKP